MLDGALAKSKSGWLVGDKCTYVDLLFFLYNRGMWNILKKFDTEYERKTFRTSLLFSFVYFDAHLCCGARRRSFFAPSLAHNIPVKIPRNAFKCGITDLSFLTACWKRWNHLMGERAAVEKVVEQERRKPVTQH